MFNLRQRELPQPLFVNQGVEPSASQKSAFFNQRPRLSTTNNDERIRQALEGARQSFEKGITPIVRFPGIAGKVQEFLRPKTIEEFAFGIGGGLSPTTAATELLRKKGTQKAITATYDILRRLGMKRPISEKLVEEISRWPTRFGFKELVNKIEGLVRTNR